MKRWYFAAISNFSLETYICTRFGIPNPLQSPDIGQNTNGGISNFLISGQCLINKNFSNSRNSSDIDIKVGPVTKLDKRNEATSKFKKKKKKLKMILCQQIVTSLSFFQFIANLDQSRNRILVCKTYIFIISNLLS